MKRNNKKGFTIIELVIVIAVIAILAAVLIPTFSSIIKKANQSVDTQAVQQMNTLLATHVDGSIKNVSDAIRALDEEDIDLDNYKALQKNHYFYFVMNGKTPMIIYANEKNEIVYPEVTLSSDVQWMSLSGQVPTDSDYTIENNAVTIDSGAKLAHLIEAKKNTSENLTIILKGDVDLKGAAVDFGKTTANITIKSEDNSRATLSGLRADDNAVSPTGGEYEGHKYGFGLFGEVNGKVVIENVTISGLNVGKSEGSHNGGANTVGLVAGYIYGTVELKGVTFKDCVVNGYQKVGGIVGQLHGTLNMTNVNFENVSVNGYVEVAKVAGIVNKSYTEGSTTIDGSAVTYKKYDGSNKGGNLTHTGCDFSGITVNGLCDNVGQIVINKSQINGALKGDSDNTYATWTDYSYLWGLATADLAWYTIDDMETKNNGKIARDNNGKYVPYNYVTIDGSQYGVCYHIYSTSNNLSNGAPTN